MSDFQFPNFNTPGFPFQNFLDQLAASLQQPASGSYARFGGAGGNPTPTPGGTPSGPSNPPITIPNFPAYGPGQSPFTPGLPNVGPAGTNGVTPTGGPAPGGPGATPNGPTAKPPSLLGQPKAAVQGGLLGQFSNGMGLNANNLPAMLGGGQASTPQAQAFVNAYNQMNPSLSYSPQAVQNAQNAGRNDLAYLMLAQGGQGLRDAAGATPDQINNAFYNQGGANVRYDPATIAALLQFGARRG